MNGKSSESMSPAAQKIQTWFADARPTEYDAFAALDDARARGLISREEYISLLDTAL